MDIFTSLKFKINMSFEIISSCKCDNYKWFLYDLFTINLILTKFKTMNVSFQLFDRRKRISQVSWEANQWTWKTQTSKHFISIYTNCIPTQFNRTTTRIIKWFTSIQYTCYEFVDGLSWN